MLMVLIISLPSNLLNSSKNRKIYNLRVRVRSVTETCTDKQVQCNLNKQVDDRSG